MTAPPMTCGHKAEVMLSWVGHREERREVRSCEACAAILWNALSTPLRETFTCEEIAA